MARRAKEPNRLLEALIAEAGLSHKGLARRVNDTGKGYGVVDLSYDHSSVMRWLAGQQPKPPTPDLIAEVLTTRLGRAITATDTGMRQSGVHPELGLAFDLIWQNSLRTVSDLWRSDIDRRAFLVGAGYAAGAFAAPAMRWLTAPADMSVAHTGTRRVTTADVDAVREVTGLFRKLDNRWGGGHPRAMVVQYFHDEVPPLLNGTYTDEVGRDLFAAVAELTHLAGWMAYDLEQHGLAQRYMIQALRLARAAGDYAFGGEVLAAMGQQALYVERPDEAIDLARAALLSARKVKLPALLSEALISEARALAALGDRRGSMHALAAAERALDGHDPDAAPPWIRYYDEAYLSAQLGHCLRKLGDLDTAELHAHRSLCMTDGYARGQVLNVTLLASIHAEQGDVERACDVGGRAAELAVDVKSRRARHRIGELRALLGAHSRSPVVSGFLEATRPVSVS